MNTKIRVSKGERIAWYLCIAILVAIFIGWFLKGCGYWVGF